MRDGEEYKNKKSKTDNGSGQHKSVLNPPQFLKQGGMHHHLEETELIIMVKIPELSLHIHSVVWRKEIVCLLLVLSVIEITMASVMKAQ